MNEKALKQRAFLVFMENYTYFVNSCHLDVDYFSFSVFHTHMCVCMFMYACINQSNFLELMFILIKDVGVHG